MRLWVGRLEPEWLWLSRAHLLGDAKWVAGSLGLGRPARLHRSFLRLKTQPSEGFTDGPGPGSNWDPRLPHTKGQKLSLRCSFWT